MPAASRSHLVLIPSYNAGAKVLETVNEARQLWKPVWVVVDGSTDGSGEALLKRQENDPGLRVFILPRNLGKGAAVLHGLREAVAAGFSHVLTMDADGQHPAAKIPQFMRASQRAPDALILGRPVFDLSAPKLRVGGRKISNWWANLETLWAGIDDSASTRPARCSKSCRPAGGCGVSISTSRRPCGWFGLAYNQLISMHRCAIFHPKKVAYRTSSTCATTHC